MGVKRQRRKLRKNGCAQNPSYAQTLYLNQKAAPCDLFHLLSRLSSLFLVRNLRPQIRCNALRTSNGFLPQVQAENKARRLQAIPVQMYVHPETLESPIMRSRTVKFRKRAPQMCLKKSVLRPRSRVPKNRSDLGRSIRKGYELLQQGPALV